jgi:ATP synthase protein I
MNGKKKPKSYQDEFRDKIVSKAEQKMTARQNGCKNYQWFGVFGLVGWSVTIPLAAGLALGIWLDSRIHGRYSFTIMLMLAGLALGCWLAWYWLQKSAGCFDNGKKGKGGKSCKE